MSKLKSKTQMSNRHFTRRVVLQTLFEWDFNGSNNSNIKDILNRNIEEFGLDLIDVQFAEKLLEAIVNNIETLDEIIKRAAPEWPIERIAIIDRNSLRIGLYELIYANKKEVPSKVAINEAIEISKTFGGEKSGRFINGVLGMVYKEMGEPGKDEESKNKKPIDTNKFPIDKLAGAVIYAIDNNILYLAMVHDVFGYWTLSKGKIKNEETDTSGVVRAIKDEIGADIEIEGLLGSNEYIASDPTRGKIRKQVSYFLGKTNKKDLHLKPKGGLDDAKWFRAEDIVDLKLYEDIKPLIEKSLEKISKPKN